jgi:hypothetical protein
LLPEKIMFFKKSPDHSFIHGIQIASPCNVSWDSMTGDDLSRHCHSCSLNVYNISAMTTREAEELISEKEGRLCLRFYRRNDGTILTQDCPRGIKAIRDRWMRGVASLAALVSVAALYAINTSKAGVVQEMAIQVNSKAETVTKTCSLRPEMGDYAEPRALMGAVAPSYQVTAGVPSMPAEFEAKQAIEKLEKLTKKRKGSK